jgi:hypothetical protein
MPFPSAIDSYTAVQGTSLVASSDHANMHNVAGSAIVNIETTLGTNSGTSVLKNMTAGDFAIRMNTGGTVRDTLTKGTVNNFVAGSPSITGGTIAAMQLIGTSQFTGGTVANAAIGTPTLIGNGTIAMSGTLNPIRPGAALAPTVGTAADAAGGTIAVNAQAAQVWEINLGTTAGNRTIGTPSNLADGQFLGYRIKQNTNNTGTLVWATTFRGTVNTNVLGTQSTWNYYAWRYNATDAKLDFQGNNTGII